METVKTLGVVAVLVVVGYLGYVAVTNQPNEHPPIDANTPWAQSDAAGQSPGEGIPGGGAQDYSSEAGASSSGTGSLDVSPGREVSPQSLGLGRPTASIPAPGAGDRRQIGGATGQSTASTTSGDSQAAIAQPEPRGIRKEFATFLDAAYEKLDQGDFADVLQVLSPWYGDPRLTPEENAQLLELLDQLAGTVIYSRQHHLAQPYIVQAGESLPQIADRYDVPWQLLAKINGIPDPERISPGMELKVVPGPFEAVIHLGDRTLTLMLDGMYAGRFPIGVGNDVPNLEGSYKVHEKLINPTYYGPDGVLEPEDPRNPLGKRWIGLGGRIGIHGTNDPGNFDDLRAKGTIFLSDRDVEDVYDILSIGSRVLIQR